MAKALTSETAADLISQAVGESAKELVAQLDELGLKQATHEWQSVEMKFEGGGVLKIGKMVLTVSK